MASVQKFLDNQTGLPTLWGLIKTNFVKKEDGKKLSSEDFTTDLKNKLNKIAEDGEKNQNAYSTVKAGETEISAATTTDTFEIAAGENVQVAGDGESKKITISATDTTYEPASADAPGLMSSEDYTKLKGIDAGAQKNQNAFSKVTVSEDSVEATLATDTLTIEAGSNIGVVADTEGKKITISASIEHFDLASEKQNGLMSSADFKKLKGIEEGAQKNVITEIQKNTVKVEPAEGVVNIEVPKDLKDLTNTPGYQTQAEVQEAINTAVAGAYVFKGSVESEDQLEVQDPEPTKGDVYNIQAASSYGPAGMNVAWDGDKWDALGGSFKIEAMEATEIQEICTLE